MVTQTQTTPRMTLESIQGGRRVRPVRVVGYGPEGVGKSTFGAGAPSPVFIGPEDGTDHLDVQRFPAPKSLEDVYDAVRVLGTTDHSYQTLVIDTLDWMEPVLWDHICKRDAQDNIEAYGYGKGYVAAVDEWRRLLSILDRLRDVKSMHIVLLAHSWIRSFKNPEGEDFDRYQLKLHDKSSGLIKEWADCVLFFNYETYAAKDSKTKRIRGVSTGSRLIHTTRTAAYDAKNRYDLPESMPLDWSDFFAAVQTHRPADPVALLAEITRKAKLIGGDAEAKAMAKTVDADAATLAKINDRLNALIAQKETDESC